MVAVLCKTLGCAAERAVQLMLEAHTTGRAVVWTGTKEVAELKVEQIRTFHETHPGTGARQTSFLHVDRPGVVVDAVKKAEDSDVMIVRLYEAWGQRGPARLTCARQVTRARRADLLEHPHEALQFEDDGSIALNVRPFEILTLLLELA